MQGALQEILEAIYEQDFLDCSHGFRPRRSPPSLQKHHSSDGHKQHKEVIQDIIGLFALHEQRRGCTPD